MENKNISDYVFICIIIFVIICTIIYLHGSKESMISFKVNEKKFKVYDRFKNHDIAGKMLYEIDSRIHKLFNHLNEKYLQSNKYNIDSTLKQRIRRMVTSYKTHHLKENFPESYTSSGGKPDSSFTLNKKDMSICLRDDDTKKFHNINEIMFVVLHELSHILNKTFNHPKLFWQNFKFLLYEANEIGIYIPIDYGKHNVKYCNTELKANPYFTVFECNTGIPHTC
jgi:hypothetical protein